MKRLLSASTALFLLMTICGCSQAPNPPGTGASGKPLEVAPDTGVPDEVKNPAPGSGLGGGPGDGTGRDTFPDKAGKADHERGAGGKNKKAEAAKATEASKEETPKTDDAPKVEAPKAEEAPKDEK